MANVVNSVLTYADVLLLLLAMFLYVTDLGKLLYVNELFFAGARGASSIGRVAHTGIVFNRRYAHFPLLLTPGTIVLRSTWPTANTATTDTAAIVTRLEQCLRKLRVPRVMCTLLLPQIFVGIPLLYLLSGSLSAVVLLLVIYLQVIAMLVWLLLQRRALELPGWKVLGLWFEALVCVPYALNLHRKIADQMLRDLGRFDALAMADALLDDAANDRFRSDLADAAARRLELTSDDSVTRSNLRRLAEYSEQESTNGPHSD